MQTPIRTVFFGTHQFAAVILKGLAEHPAFSMCLVVTQPDRPTGRSHMMEKPPVKAVAEQCGIEIAQPETLKSFSFSTGHVFDIGIVAQYGLLIPTRLLNVPTYGMVNVHTSLLPKYRGASPIQTAILRGDTETGVSIIELNAGLDSGRIITQKKISMGPDDTYRDVEMALADEALSLLIEAVPRFVSGDIHPIAQNEILATHTKQLTRDDGRVDWSMSARDIYNQYRGLTPWPGIWTSCVSKRVKFLSIKPTNVASDPGRITITKDTLTIGCGQGSIAVEDLQMEGKKIMSAAEFINGFRHMDGMVCS